MHTHRQYGTIINSTTAMCTLTLEAGFGRDGGDVGLGGRLNEYVYVCVEQIGLARSSHKTVHERCCSSLIHFSFSDHIPRPYPYTQPRPTSAFSNVLFL